MAKNSAEILAEVVARRSAAMTALPSAPKLPGDRTTLGHGQPGSAAILRAVASRTPLTQCTAEPAGVTKVQVQSQALRAIRAEKLARRIEALAVKAAQAGASEPVHAATGAFAAGHKFWGNQWSQHATHPETDPPGEPSGKIKHAVLVINGGRYRGKSHFQAAQEFWSGKVIEPSKMDIQHEGFETESGHFLNRAQAARYAFPDIKKGGFGYRSELASEELRMTARDGKLYTQDAVHAAAPITPDPFQAHARAQDAALKRSKRAAQQIIAMAEAEAQAQAQKEADAKKRKKRRDEFLAAAALLLFGAGVAAYRAAYKILGPEAKAAHDTSSSVAAPAEAPAPGSLAELLLIQPQPEAPSEPPPMALTEPAPVTPEPEPEASVEAPDVINAIPDGLATEPPDLDAEAEQFAEERAEIVAKFPKTVLDRLEAKLAAAKKSGMTNHEIYDQLHSEAEQIETGAGKRWAEAEAQAAYGASQIRALARAGFSTKAWVTIGDDRVRPTHVRCEKQGDIPINHKFSNGLMFPGDLQGGPEETVGCRCVILGGSRRKLDEHGKPTWASEAVGHKFHGNQYSYISPERINNESKALSAAKELIETHGPDIAKDHRGSEIETALLDGANHKRVARDAHRRIVGAISFHHEQGEPITITHLGSLQGGVGSKLLKAVQDRAKKHGTHIEIESTPNAEKFYEKHGFVHHDPTQSKLMSWHPS